MLAKRLSNLRNEFKKTQQQMADFLGITRPAYTAYERGTRQPDYETLKKLADFFDVSTDYLLGRTDEPQGKWRPASMDFIEDENRPFVFAERLKDRLGNNSFAREQAAEYSKITVQYLEKLMFEPEYSKHPGVRTLYKLAEFLKVTPDYLGGYTDDPQGHDPRTPRPKDMEKFLEKEEIMLYGEILDEEDKEKLNNILAAVFLDAKKRNKRK